MSVFANIITGQTIASEELKDSMLTGTITFSVGGQTLTADMLLPQNAPTHATPIVGSIYHDGKLIWKFQNCRPTGFDGRAHLIEVNGQVIIAWVNRSMTLIDINSVRQIVDGTSLGLKTSVELKFAAAKLLCCDNYELTTAEAKVAAAVNAKRTAELKARLEAERVAREEQKAARAAARKEKRQRILGRQELLLKGPAGKHLHGTPVVGDEWECLPDGTWVVEVSTYQDGHVGDLLRHGVVSKKGGRVEIKSVEADLQFADRVEMEELQKPEQTGTRLVEFEGDIHEVPFYPVSDVKTLKILGIVGVFATCHKGKLLVARIKKVDGKMTLSQVKATEFNTAA